jgi:hypothetical protein
MLQVLLRRAMCKATQFVACRRCAVVLLLAVLLIVPATPGAVEVGGGVEVGGSLA